MMRVFRFETGHDGWKYRTKAAYRLWNHRFWTNLWISGRISNINSNDVHSTHWQYFSFWDLLPIKPFQLTTTLTVLALKGSQTSPPNLRRCPLTSRSMNSAATPALSPHDWQGGKNSNTDDRAVSTRFESWDQKLVVWRSQKTTAKKTHPNRSFIAGVQWSL